MQEWTYCYRMRSGIRNLGLWDTLFMVIMTILSVVAWLGQPANDPVKMPFVILGFLLFTALYVYLLLLYHRYRLFVSDASIRQIGVLRFNHVELSVIDELKWRLIPDGGSVRMAGIFGVLKIEFGILEKEDRLQLIDFLRSTIPESKQIGWQKFNERFADSPQKQRQSLRAKLLFAFIFGAHAIAFGIIWAIGGGIQFLIYSAINALMTVYLLRSHRQNLETNALMLSLQESRPKSNGQLQLLQLS